MRACLVLFLALTLFTGALYPLVVTGFALVCFPAQARGSLIERDGIPLASEWIGREFRGSQYFWGRLSATSPEPYMAFDRAALSGSTGSNYGPLHPALREAAAARIAALRAAETAVGADATRRVPIDLVTASASGLDPHISKSGAAYQVQRVALARGIAAEVVNELVREHTVDRGWGFLGEPVVHVLRLNLALDRLHPLGEPRAR